MKVKLDENLPVDAIDVVARAGHEGESVASEGMSGAPDGAVVVAAAAEGRFLITLDRGMADIRRHPPGSHAGIAVMRVADQSVSSVLDALAIFLRNHDLAAFAGCTVVVRGHLVRVRRPGP